MERSTRWADLTAGLTVGAMLVPQAMAYALLAGLPPETGLYASIVPLVLYAWFGTSRQLAVGPVAIVSLLSASALAGVAAEGTSGYVAAAGVLALLVGAVHLVLGLGRLGFLVRLLSHPVLVGFTSAAALIIGFSQVKHLLGVSIDRSEHFYETVRGLAQALGDAHPTTLVVGATAIVLMVGLRRWVPAVPGALAAVVLTTVASVVLDLESRGVAVVGDIPQGLPALTVPDHLGTVGQLLPAAVVITLVGFMESIAVGKVYARRNHYELDPNRELVGLGVANLGSGLFGGYPVTGGFSRTAVNAEAGARTKFAAVVTAGVVLLVIVALTPLLTQLPSATLGAIVVVAVAKLVDLREIRHITEVRTADLLTVVVSFFATLALGVELGIAVAVGVSIVLGRLARPRREEPLRSADRGGTMPVQPGSREPGGKGAAVLVFEQYYLDCLSQASYLIGDTSTGRAVVVDPRRDVDLYVAEAEAHGLSIELVIETHFHADFLSGHLELAERTGARIAYGEAGGEAEFAARKLVDGERINLGEVVLEIRATPGHTPESVSIVVWEHESDEAPYGVLTGDTLFIGDVGRPDLLASVGVTADELATMLYDSLRTKLLTLPDDTRVFPAHGAGSACGKNLSTETQSTIGEQRRTNYALADMSRDDFVHLVTEGQPTVPGYFVYDAKRNRQLHPLLDDHDAPTPMSMDGVLAARDAGAVLLDTRQPEDFAAGHVRGAVNVGLEGRFAEYAGTVASPDERIVLICDPGTELEAKVRLGRIGYDDVVGVLDEPYKQMLERPEEVERASRVTVAELDEAGRHVDELQVVDVRNPGETALGTVPGALEVPLARLRQEAERLDPDRPTVVYCAGGYRSSIAASLLRAHGFDDVSDLAGGYTAWSSAHAPA